MREVANRKLPMYVAAPPAVHPPRRVLVVCMPFQHVRLSSLSVALLATVLREHDVPAAEAYLHFEFARLLGPATYSVVSEHGAKNSILGELLFAEAYHGGSEPAVDALLLPLFGTREVRAAMMERFGTYCVEHVERERPEIIGFTTSFNQLFPSLWLARLVKQRAPATKVVFGGASCSDPMGRRISEHYREVDLVVSGFAEMALVDLAFQRTGYEPRFLHNESRVALDVLPIPAYESFLDQWSGFADSLKQPTLSFESSRGCWWGEKNHCKFCGLNQVEMKFTAKSAERVVDEIRTLWGRHQLGLFATDTILSRSHLERVMPQLAGYADRPELFYEVKPNMRRRELEVMRQANVTSIQPGIESLSTRLLRLLNKGVRAIQNVALLKWCREQKIRPVWNLLYGIPGEQHEDYLEQLALIEKLPHLAPPEGAHLIQIDRYSPYFRNYREHGWAEIKPLPEYSLLHRFMDEAEVRDVAYHFTGVGAPFVTEAYAPSLKAAVERWQTRHRAGDGIYWTPTSGLMFVADGSISTLERTDEIDAIIDHTNEVTSIRGLVERTGVDEALIAELVELGVLWREGESVINLVVALPD